ncbi:hypothetical protein Tco_0805374 [Tanacetum coccineum]
MDNVQAMIDADYELATKLQAEEQGEISIEERSKLFMELMNERNKHFARLRAEDHRRKPLTKAQKRNQMSNYLKNMTGYTLAVPELAAGSSKRDAEEELDQESFDRDDLVMLWSLVKETFNLTEPKMHKEKGYGRLYDSCGVHHVSIEKGIDIYMLVEKEYPLSRGTLTLMCSKDLGGTRYECPEIFLGRYSCRLKTKKDEVFGRILLENKL